MLGIKYLYIFLNITIKYFIHVTHILYTIVCDLSAVFLENVVYFFLESLLNVRMFGQFVQNETQRCGGRLESSNEKNEALSRNKFVIEI